MLPQLMQQAQGAEFEFMQKWLAWLGPNHIERIKTIDALFEQRTKTIWSTCYADFSKTRQRLPGMLGLFDSGTVSDRMLGIDHLTTTRIVFFTVTRSLASMDFRERTFLRLAELLNSAYNGNDATYRLWRAALLWGDGKGTLTDDVRHYGLDESE